MGRKQQEGSVSGAQVFHRNRVHRGLMSDVHSSCYPLHHELNRLWGAILGTQPLALIFLYIYKVNNILFINSNNLI